MCCRCIVPFVKSATARSFQGPSGSMSLQRPPPAPPVRATPPRQLPPNAQLTPFPPQMSLPPAQASPTPQLQPLLMTPGATNTFSRMQPAQGLARGQSPGAATPLTKQQTTSYEYSYVSGGNGGPGASPGGYQNAQFANSLPQGARSSQSRVLFPLFAV